MASKAKTRAKLSGNGRAVVATIPLDRLRAMVGSLPKGEDRAILEAAIVEADEIGISRAREERMKTPLSIESLAPLGWMMTGEHSTLAYGAIRTGDFRDEGDGHWAFGPDGAFDREDADVAIMRDATQAGVMSEEHFAYRLLPPTADRQAAILNAMRLEAEWRAQLPRSRRKPKALLEGGVYGHEAKGMYRSDWRRHTTQEDVKDLIEDACLSPSRKGAKPSEHDWRVSDIVHGEGGRPTVAIFKCDAVLRPIVISTGSSLHGYTRTDGHRWSVGSRDYNPTFDIRRPRPLSSPYDCVLGGVWSVSHNAQITAAQFQEFRRTWYDGLQGGLDRRDNEVFPLATREEAEAAAHSFAVGLGIMDGKAKAMPATIATPDFQDSVDFAQVA